MPGKDIPNLATATGYNNSKWSSRIHSEGTFRSAGQLVDTQLLLAATQR